MYNMLREYEDTNLIMRQEGADIRTGIALNKEQVLEAYISSGDGLVYAHITQIDEYLFEEDIEGVDLSKIVEIVPVGTDYIHVYSDDDACLLKLTGGYTVVANQQEMIMF